MSTIAEEITALNTNLAAAKAAVTTAGGTVGDTGLAGLATEIATIPSGGGGEVESKYIDFYDYDGTRLYSWTKQELDNATELPANPTHAGLTSRGWNWTLAQLRDQGTPMDVGQMYRPTDGKTHLFVDVDADTREPRIALSISSGLTVGTTVATIDWGDGSPTEDIVNTSTSAVTLVADHTYSQTGRYEVTIDIPDEVYGYVSPVSTYTTSYTACLAMCSLWRGQDSPSNKTTVKNANYARQIKELWVGKNLGLGINPFGRSGIEKVVLSDTLQEADFSHASSSTAAGSLFYQCNFLKYYVVPTGLTMSNITANKSSVFGSVGIEGSCLPYGSTIYANNNNRITGRATPPKTSSYTNISNYFREVYLPDGLVSLDTLNAYAAYVKYPSSLTSVPNLYGVNGSSATPPTTMYYPTTLDFSDFTSIPTRASTSINADNLPGLVIKVPAALEADWKADASWSNLANYIVGV